MLLLTRLNGSHYYVNPELIRFVERTPDTVITLVDQTKLVVSDPVEVVIDRYMKYRRQINAPWQPEDAANED